MSSRMVSHCLMTPFSSSTLANMNWPPLPPPPAWYCVGSPPNSERHQPTTFCVTIVVFTWSAGVPGSWLPVPVSSAFVPSGTPTTPLVQSHPMTTLQLTARDQPVHPGTTTVRSAVWFPRASVTWGRTGAQSLRGKPRFTPPCDGSSQREVTTLVRVKKCMPSGPYAWVSPNNESFQPPNE